MHKETLVMAAMREGTGEIEEQEVPNDPAKIQRAFGRLKQEGGALRACYEAGPCGYTLQRQLAGMGIPCDVIAPSLIPKRAGDRIKTDRRDARKLMRLYRAGELTPIRVPEEREEAVRDLMRCREDLLKTSKRYRQQLGHFLNRHGRLWMERNWTQKHWQWVRTQRFDDPAAQTVLQEYVSAVEDALDRLRRLERQIAEIAGQAPYRETVGRLCCLRGISTISAMTLVTEVLDFRRFGTPRELMGYLGLVPSEHSSGGRQSRGGITKAGNTHARRVLVEAAWHYRHGPLCGPTLRKRQDGQPREVVTHAMRAQHRLNQRYRRLTARGKPPQVVVVAVARELTAFVWAIAVGRVA